MVGRGWITGLSGASLVGIALGATAGTDEPTPARLQGLPTAVRRASIEPDVPPAPRADAGDDNVGLVGRQITLNGVKSEPRGQVGYRWLQVGGPEVRLKVEDGYILTFVPETVGTYRFALVVAIDRVISEPDYVDVTIGTTPAPAAAPVAPPAPPTISPEDQASAALRSVRGGSGSSTALADAFDGVADRIDLYDNAGEAFAELAKRLESILPAEPRRRSTWDERVFKPLTGRVIAELRAAGVDLGRPEGQSAPLADAQRERLEGVLRAIAEGFRAAGAPKLLIGTEAVAPNEGSRR